MINYYGMCNCGAITIEIDDMYYSCERKDFKKYFPDIDLRNYKSVRAKYIMYCCDYCVNHYGLDLCACGSGEKIIDCACGCGQPMQIIGKYNCVRGVNSWLR